MIHSSPSRSPGAPFLLTATAAAASIPAAPSAAHTAPLAAPAPPPSSPHSSARPPPVSGDADRPSSHRVGFIRPAAASSSAAAATSRPPLLPPAMPPALGWRLLCSLVVVAHLLLAPTSGAPRPARRPPPETQLPHVYHRVRLSSAQSFGVTGPTGERQTNSVRMVRYNELTRNVRPCRPHAHRVMHTFDMSNRGDGLD